MRVDDFMEEALPQFETKLDKEITDLFFLFVQSDKELMKKYLDTVATLGNLQSVNSQISRYLGGKLEKSRTGVINENPHSNLIQSYAEREDK